MPPMPPTLPTPLVTADWLAEHLHDPDLRVLDVRFDLRDSAAGLGAYRAGHVPGAVYLDLERDLSGPKRPDGAGGRHPLPEPHVLAARLGALGVGSEHRVVVYDDPSGGNGMFAARAWWLLRLLGHEKVAVLNGGWGAWRAAAGPVEVGEVTEVRTDPATFEVRLREDLLANADTLSGTLLDSRAPARYRGEVEPLDKKAGHIPGARNLDWSTALGADGRFLEPDEQRARLGELAGEPLTVYCGSGVSAGVNLLALELAGRPPGPDTRLYAGSWSDWISDPDREVEVGPERPVK